MLLGFWVFKVFLNQWHECRVRVHHNVDVLLIAALCTFTFVLAAGIMHHCVCVVRALCKNAYKN